MGEVKAENDGILGEEENDEILSEEENDGFVGEDELIHDEQRTMKPKTEASTPVIEEIDLVSTSEEEGEIKPNVSNIITLYFD